MKTMIIYDNTGYIYLQLTSDSNRIPEGGIQYLEVDVPSGKRVVSMDMTVTPNEPIYEDIPKTDIELASEEIAELKAQAAQTEYALMMGGLI